MTENNLEMAIDSMVASRESRREDWDTLAFQTKAGPEYRRAQIRYVGSGGTGHHDNDGLILEADHFTFSNMLLPPGAVGPEHDHHDVEEAFFVLEGELDARPGSGDDTPGGPGGTIKAFHCGDPLPMGNLFAGRLQETCP